MKNIILLLALASIALCNLNYNNGSKYNHLERRVLKTSKQKKNDIVGTYCAKEGGKCKCNGLVRFGHQENFSNWMLSKGVIDCKPEIFGNIHPIKVRKCYCQDMTSISPSVKDKMCNHKKEFRCPEHYYPVCGDLPGRGFLHTITNSHEECADKCDNYQKCVGAEWFYQRDRTVPEGTCYLNDRYATTKGSWPGANACYKFLKIYKDAPVQKVIYKKKYLTNTCLKNNDTKKTCLTES